MGSVNVNRSVSDAFYRYKMPRICAKVEGKGNGIKTVIVNMSDVAKAIGRPATYPTKYFGCELGAQTQFDIKNERFIVNGSHDPGKLQDLLDGFIRKFVLCPECDNPETDLMVNAKKQTISQACKACGFHGLIEFNHKLNTFILKNPPNAPTGQASGSEGKRSKRSKKGSATTNGDTSNGGDGHADSEYPAEVIPKISREMSSEKAKNDEDDENWAVDVSEEAVRARLLDLTDGAKNMTLNDDLEKSEKQRMDLFYEYVKSKRDAQVIELPATQKEILSEAERLEIKSKSPLVLAELLFTASIASEVKRHRMLFLRFTHQDARAQRALLGGVEQVVALHKEVLLPKTAVILKLLYDADILEEAVLLDWADKVSRKYVSRELGTEMRKFAEPLIKWLREASEEEDNQDSEDEDEEDDLEIEYDDRAKTTPMKAQPPPPKPKLEDDDENDVDIDAI
ncbi:eukaryotic translation initiation factor 5 [Arctopsyche grandis]|uniref:eukaryotic translation initiation factor 5 n=1 Tax=Arctopsyche grandis TaxID=121162 RepID=UPI00406D912A